VRANIDAHGQHVWIVVPLKDGPPGEFPFAYTVGNHERGMPELLVTGPVSSDMGRWLNYLGEMQRERNQGFEEGEIVRFDHGLALKMADAGSRGRNECAIGVSAFFDTDSFDLLQVLVGDTAGRFPDDPGFTDDPYYRQPILRQA
jgi:hypothetical protein